MDEGGKVDEKNTVPAAETSRALFHEGAVYKCGMWNADFGMGSNFYGQI
jgi:hypothetical protein